MHRLVAAGPPGAAAAVSPRQQFWLLPDPHLHVQRLRASTRRGHILASRGARGCEPMRSSARDQVAAEQLTLVGGGMPTRSEDTASVMATAKVSTSVAQLGATNSRSLTRERSSRGVGAAPVFASGPAPVMRSKARASRPVPRALHGLRTRPRAAQRAASCRCVGGRRRRGGLRVAARRLPTSRRWAHPEGARSRAAASPPGVAHSDPDGRALAGVDARIMQHELDSHVPVRLVTAAGQHVDHGVRGRDQQIDL